MDASCGTVYSNVLTVTVELPPTVNAGPDDTICYESDFYDIPLASVTNAFNLQWSTPNGDGIFVPDNVTNARYNIGALDKNSGKGSAVKLVLAADGNGACSSTTITDTLDLLIPPQLLVAVGTPAPFIIGPNTKVNVAISVEDRNYLSDLSYYLVSPDDSMVVLKEAWDPLSYCNFGEDADLEFIRFPEPADTLEICPGGGGYINLSGTFKATGDWSNLHGQDPANGIWKIVLKDAADFIYKPGPEDGQLVYASIEFADTNANGDTVNLFYDSGASPIPITNTSNALIPVQTNFVVALGLRTRCYGSCDATAVVTPAGGIGPYTIQWSDGLGTNDTIDLCAGSYSVTVTDAMGCTASIPVNVVSPPQIEFTSVTFTDSMLCGGSANAIIAAKAIGGTGKLTYTLLPGNIPSSEADSGRFENLSGGTYTLHVEDINGCFIDTVLIIFEPDPLAFSSTVITGLTCSGSDDGVITAAAEGGTTPYTYSITPGSEVNSDGIFDGLSQGAYVVGVTDANNCDTVFTNILTVDAPDPLTVDTIIVSQPICNSDSGRIAVTASGGTMPYYISFTGGPDSIPFVVTSTLLFRPGSAEGKDAIILTGNANDDMNYGNHPDLYALAWTNAGIPVTARSMISFDLSAIPEGSLITSARLSLYSYNSPSDGSHSTMDGSNASLLQRIKEPWDEHTVTWNNQPPTSTEDQVTLPASTSDIQHYENIDVTALIQDMVNNPDSSYGMMMRLITEQLYRRMLFASSDNSNASLHPKLEVDYTAGVSGTNYFDLPAGSYDIVMYDANGCSYAWPTTITLDNPPPITIDNINITDINGCYGDSTGAVSVDATGGWGDFSYALDAGPYQPGNLFSNLGAGGHTLFVRDSMGCQVVIDTINISQPSELIVQKITTWDINAQSGTITLVASGGIPPYQYSIDNGMNLYDTNYFDSLAAGVYDVYVVDDNGCEYSDTAIVSAQLLNVFIHEAVDASCFGFSDAGFIVEILNGTPPYNILITDSVTGTIVRQINGYIQNFFSDENFSAGSYTVTITDVNSQIYVNTFYFSEPPMIQPHLSVTDASCSNNTDDGAAALNPTGGSGTFTFEWSDDSTVIAASRQNLPAGFYEVNVIDVTNTNCRITTGFYINSNDSASAYAGEDTTVCPGVAYMLDGATNSPYFSWSPGAYLNDSIFLNPVARVYSRTSFILTVTNGDCWDKDTVAIDVYPVYGIDIYDPSGEVDIDTAVFILEGETPLVAASEGFVSYLWAPASGVDDPTAREVVLSPVENQSYIVFGTTLDECIESDTISVRIARGIKIYNSFTPNGDGFNDKWIIENAADYGTRIVIRIFNRWGELVYYSIGYYDYFAWDGTMKGKDLPIGTYYYIIDLNDGKTKPLTGAVTLIR